CAPPRWCSRSSGSRRTTSWKVFPNDSRVRRDIGEPAAALVENDRPTAPACVRGRRGSTVAEMRVRVGGRRHRRLAGESVLAHPEPGTLDLAAFGDRDEQPRADVGDVARPGERFLLLTAAVDQRERE